MKHCNPNVSKPCGNTCISKNYCCHVDKCSAPKQCNPYVSQPCGKTCISKDKTCHIDPECTTATYCDVE